MGLLRLERPTEKHEAQVMQMRQEFFQNKDEFHGCAGLEDTDSYAHWLKFEQRGREKYKDGYTPSEVFLGVREADGKVVGIIDFRHPISGFLLEYGGSIGYSVRPGERRKGYAGEMLRLLIPICRQYEEPRVLLTCDKANIASQKTITGNGGILENEVPDIHGMGSSGVIQRYWITL